MDNELKLDELNSVSGGTSPMLPVSEQPANRPYDLGADIQGAQAEQLPQIFAYCKLCGAQVTYLGQTRIGGGNTGEYKCMNPACANYNQIIYNDGVDIP